MAWENKYFDAYRIWHGTGTSTDVHIRCIHGNTTVGNIYFKPDGTNMPSNSRTSRGVLNLYYSISRFNEIITTLRYEKPLWIWFDTDTKWGYIATAQESTGEEESSDT